MVIRKAQGSCREMDNMDMVMNKTNIIVTMCQLPLGKWNRKISICRKAAIGMMKRLRYKIVQRKIVR